MRNLIQRIQNRLLLRKIQAYREIQGWLSPLEAITLYKLGRQTPPGGVILEIGSWKGKSTYCLASGLRDGLILAIDPFDASGEEGSAEVYRDYANEDLYRSFLARMDSLGIKSKVKVLRGKSEEFVEQISEIAVLFIDGDHSFNGCKYDYETYHEKIVLNGCLVFHDYDPARPDFGPTRVIEKVVDKSKFTLDSLADSLWIGRRKSR